MEKQCSFCGKNFSTESKRQQYCCHACAQAMFRKKQRVLDSQKEKPELPEKTCPVCGKKFTPATRKYQKYCSPECKYHFKMLYNREHWRQTHQTKLPLAPKVCPYCGKTFQPINAHVVYCTPECQYQNQLRLANEKNQKTVPPFYNPRKLYSSVSMSVADDVMEYFSEKWFAIDADLPWYQKHTSTLMNDPYPV